MQQNYVSRFVFFQGYALALIIVLRSLTTIYEFDPLQPFNETDDHDFESRGPFWWVIPAQIGWIASGVLLLWGTYRRNVRFLYPLAVVAALHLVAKLVRELIMHWLQGDDQDVNWHTMTFIFPVRVVALMIKTIYGMMTLLALKKLFEAEQRHVHSFVRFEAENETCERMESE